MTRTIPDLRQKAERFKRRPCVHCGADIDCLVMFRVVTASGIDQYRWACSVCWKFSTLTVDNIPHDVINSWVAAGHIPARADIPVWSDYTGERCAVCGAIGGELHHWAPEALADKFPEWNSWPAAYLCRKHHREWHEVVTPYLPGFNGRKGI